MGEELEKPDEIGFVHGVGGLVGVGFKVAGGGGKGGKGRDLKKITSGRVDVARREEERWRRTGSGRSERAAVAEAEEEGGESR